jgi:hypothetical protein
LIEPCPRKENLSIGKQTTYHTQQQGNFSAMHNNKPQRRYQLVSCPAANRYQSVTKQRPTDLTLKIAQEIRQVWTAPRRPPICFAALPICVVE